MSSNNVYNWSFWAVVAVFQFHGPPGQRSRSQIEDSSSLPDKPMKPDPVAVCFRVAIHEAELHFMPSNILW
ncbi:hypothetical protein Ddye_029978 [Dipteronia dyeriana]|uniref:Uncharacterized protein n=1 Tax=Dipteronia dyeriana TaxID=168575 RepID=A0AAD9TFT3_9ROSI|nr:hypothetical protein Ddye_029978 [Dipteronia dyeriana]